jgi:hypothetical protein
MFSVIITVISIALVAALTLATVYFGGDTFLQGKPEAEAARYINEGQQVSAAIRLYQAENQGQLPGDLNADLVGHYLKDMPEAGANWDIASDAIVKAVANAETCETVNKRAGWVNPNWIEGSDAVGKHEPVACDDAALQGEIYYCCTAPSGN